MMAIKFDKARSFFKAAEVINAVDEATRKNLAKGGAYIRTTAQRSMRYSSDPTKRSEKNKPPLAHRKGRRGPQLRKRLFFAFDHSSRSVVIGPEALGKAEAPGVMEHGGSVVRMVLRRRPKQAAGRDSTGRFKKSGISENQRAAFLRLKKEGRLKSSVRVQKTITVAARPFMGPALEKEVPKLTGVWADSVKS